ncbi:hypothetical protein JMJ35_005631, partial [Cladonia borealis]
MTLATVDLSLFKSGRDHGFVKLVGHGISNAAISQSFGWSKSFFQLRPSQVQNEDLRDAREHFDQGSPNDYQYPTRWPPERELPGFRGFMEAFFEVLEGVAADLMAALELAFGLPQGVFVDLITHPRELLKLNKSKWGT